MSAPTSHDPLVVNTKDGVTWVRRAVTQDGRGLYAVTDSCKCPPYLMVTLAELAEHGIAGQADALPVPVGPEPSGLTSEREQAIGALDLLAMMPEKSAAVVSGHLAALLAEVRGLRARVAELEAERAKYVGKEPTIAEEMAYLSRCVDAVLDLCDKADAQGITSGGMFTVDAVRKASEGLVERRSYPLVFPWAALMDEEDFYDFRADLVAATAHRPQERALAEMEKAVATWRLIAESQHGHNTAPGPNAEVSADKLTRLIAPTQVLREEPHDSLLHHDYRVSHDLPETGGGS
jgi:hypothetical protein